MKLTAKWVEGHAGPGDEQQWVGWLGGDDSNPTWDEYVAKRPPEERPVVEVEPFT